MKNKQLYDKTVGILVDAYFNDTLKHNYCTACAAGNIVAANMGFAFTGLAWRSENKTYEMPYWNHVFLTSTFRQRRCPKWYVGEAKLQIDSTGYTWQELAKIEYAFETAQKGNSDDEWMFNGLMSVIDVLDIIHENTDTHVTTLYKSKFNKTCSLSFS